MVTVIAFYLPQFHPTPYNDAWWGSGFTEWTNVRRARPLFRGHLQPKNPGELGFYDLRAAETRKLQASLAKSHGIDAFCYWHYWFDGRRLLNEVLDNVVRADEPEFSFCVGWANEDWRAVWGPRPNEVLVRQTYPGREDDRAHFDSLEPTFHDQRYLRVDGRPVFYVYRPENHPDLGGFIERWSGFAQSSGLHGMFFVFETNRDSIGHVSGSLLRLGDALVGVNWSRAFHAKDRIPIPRRGPLRVPYSRAARAFPYLVDGASRSFPCVLTGWDDTPRKGRRGVVLTGRTPELFGEQIRDAVQLSETQDGRLIFLKSWNEWAEGNYLEPDAEDGRAYLEKLSVEIASSGRRRQVE